MQLKPVDIVESISPDEFRRNYLAPGKPLIIKSLSRNWPARNKWNWDLFKKVVGDKEVGVYNNIKSDAYTAINSADEYMTFGEYIDKLKAGPMELRIFLFNIFEHAPELTKDFSWPLELSNGFVKKYPMLFTGGQGSITHMHFDIDLSHVFHTQFSGKKRVLLFPYEEQYKIYRKPWEVLSIVDFSRYYEKPPDYEKFPALKNAKGYDFILEHGDTLFMPGGMFHHMEYLEAGFAMSLRSMQPSLGGKLRGLWNLFAMRSIDTFMKKNATKWWYERKLRKVKENAVKA